jgi:hypothetical protein
VIVNQFYIVSAAVLPPEAQSPLTVYPNAPFASAIAKELLEAVAWKRSEIVECRGGIEHAQLSQRGALKIWAPATYRLSVEDLGGVLVPEAVDHRE